MMDQLIVREKYSKYWPAVAISSLLLAVLFFVAYHLIENILWVGYLRLISFSFFAIALLSFFKIKDGQVEMTVTVDDERVHSDFKVRNKLIDHHEIPKSDFYQLKVDMVPNKSIYNDLMKSDKSVLYRRKSESAWFHFNQIESRVIPLSDENADLLYHFLKQKTER